jgi:ABC transporter substrate binding protein
MDRRAFITMVGGSVLAAPLAVEAQPAGKIWRIGLFHVGLDHVPPSLDGLREGLKALGYEEGKNIRLDWRNLADEDAARTTAQVFVRDRVDLIVAFENQTVRAIQATTTEIPVVMLHVPDPVADGFVKSLAHPGGNITGFAGVGNSPAKEMEMPPCSLPPITCSSTTSTTTISAPTTSIAVTKPSSPTAGVGKWEAGKPDLGRAARQAL